MSIRHLYVCQYSHLSIKSVVVCQHLWIFGHHIGCSSSCLYNELAQLQAPPMMVLCFGTYDYNFYDDPCYLGPTAALGLQDVVLFLLLFPRDPRGVVGLITLP